VVSDKSPIDHHFSHVEQFMSRYVPSNSAMLKSIRLSFAKLAATPTIFDASCQLLNHITMAIGDLIFNLICTDVDIILPRLIWNSWENCKLRSPLIFPTSKLLKQNDRMTWLNKNISTKDLSTWQLNLGVSRKSWLNYIPRSLFWNRNLKAIWIKTFNSTPWQILLILASLICFINKKD